MIGRFDGSENKTPALSEGIKPGVLGLLLNGVYPTEDTASPDSD